MSEASHPVPPSALERWGELRARIADHGLVLFLDYDGTLAPIASRPELATMPDKTRAALQAVSKRHPTAIITGRGLADVRERVGLADIYYAANHGFEIEGPGGVRHLPAPELKAHFDRLASELAPVVRETRGIVMESKGFSIAVHYRLAEPTDVAPLQQVIERALERYPDIVLAHGKKIFELRPRFDWHKGAALTWLHRHLQAEHGPSCPLFIGDDRTDEDAFEACVPDGIGIRVGESCPWKTAAQWSVRDTDEVATLLERLSVE